ncbi:CPBP family intramembrane metalloprotease [Sporosarcina sp. P19]|nr:CPBP family intramembrane metalloprotease [Sporosarcina sp. P19]
MKSGSENIKRDIITKDVMFAFSSFSFMCIAVIFGLVVYNVLTIQSLLSFDEPIESIVITGIASIALLLFGVVLTFIIPSNYIDDMNKTYQDGTLSSLIIFMFLVALFEELLFRGIIQNLFFVYTGHQWVAILSTTVLFLVFHIQYYKKPMMLLNITIPSLVFGWVYFKTNNLLVPVFVHSIMNLGTTIMFKYKLISFKK